MNKTDITFWISIGVLVCIMIGCFINWFTPIYYRWRLNRIYKHGKYRCPKCYHALLEAYGICANCLTHVDEKRSVL